MSRASQAATASGSDARAVLEALLARNPSSRGLGIALIEARPGHVRVGFEVAPWMVGPAGECHGGFVFALADSACSYACIAHNQRVLTQSAHITQVSPARCGERLIAEATEVVRTRRGGTYDVRVTAAADGRLVALLRGQCVAPGVPAIAAGDGAAP